MSPPLHRQPIFNKLSHAPRSLHLLSLRRHRRNHFSLPQNRRHSSRHRIPQNLDRCVRWTNPNPSEGPRTRRRRGALSSQRTSHHDRVHKHRPIGEFHVEEVRFRGVQG